MVQSRALEVEGLSKRFHGNLAVDNLGFSVEGGTVHCLLGPNGSGKSTVMKMLAGLIAPDAGKIRIFGRTLTYDDRDSKSLVGFTPETPNYPDQLNPEELLTSYARFFKMREGERSSRVKGLLECVGLYESRDRKVATFTKGMKQRLSLAQAQIGDPSLLVLDEPSSGLDPIWRGQLWEMIRRLALGGKTVLMSTHVLEEVERICASVTILNHGRGLVSAEVSTLLDKASSKVLELEIDQVDDGVIRALRSLDHVKDLGLERGKILVHLSTREDVRREISNAVVSSGRAVLSMKQRTGTMEDVFVRYATGQVKAHLESTEGELRRPQPGSAGLRAVVGFAGKAEVGNETTWELHLVNVGSRPIELISVEEMVPQGIRVVDAPAEFDFQDSSLKFYDISLDPLESRTIRLIILPTETGVIKAGPRVRYLESGEERIHIVGAASVLVRAPNAPSDRSKESQRIWEFLKRELVRDQATLKLSPDSSGWRSLVQIAQGARVPASAVYGKNGNFGRPLSELLSTGAVEYKIFPKQRGRGGEVAKVRAKYDTNRVREEFQESVGR